MLHSLEFCQISTRLLVYNLDKIKKTYRFYCKKYHPDTATAVQRNNFLRIQEAYDILSDTEKRKEYDRSLGGERGRGDPGPALLYSMRTRKSTSAELAARIEAKVARMWVTVGSEPSPPATGL